MAQVLLLSGALVFLALGVGHGLLALRDVWAPRAFTPTDSVVRLAMQRSHLAFNPGLNTWKAWLGFNLSHSLGVVLFGGGLAVIAGRHFPVFADSGWTQVGVVAVAAAYLILSLRFWFWGPVLGTGLGLLCVLSSVALLRL